ncbi:lycopene cyclase domain-containing protein [Herbiconiux liukaitaii]|uniref:lycopene cyclase domain-containing protein n=1 Tax=Herbiconiux liukaitaii TaxID=3342799 RepID=UPI0035B98134
MSYWGLNAIFLAVVAVVAVAAVLVARRSVGGASARRRLAGAVGVTLAVLLAMTAVFDNIMIGVGLVGYEPSLISGAFVGIAPLEDFAYALAVAVLLPSLWVLLGAREAGSDAAGVAGASRNSEELR